MKDKLKKILLYAFAIIIAILIILSVVLSISRIEFNVFDFLETAVLTLGNGQIFVGIILAILVLFGLANSVIGMFKPPQFLENAPQWLINVYLGASILGTVALFYVFISYIL